MFTNSKYTRWYYSIITTAQSLQRSKDVGYYERHHIIPKSIGGDNSKSNLVLLTAKEHYTCHLLLVKMCVNSKHKSKMVYAYMMLSKAADLREIHRWCGRSYERMRNQYIPLISGKNNYMYGVPKSDAIIAKQLATKQERGLFEPERNPMYGKNHTDETKAVISKKKKALINEDRLARMVVDNPRSRPVKTPAGVFPSLSAARRHYGLGGKASAIIRINRGEWEYV